MELISQYDCWKAEGLPATYALQLDARLEHDELPQTAPAH
jgi:hypothetical protein